MNIPLLGRVIRYARTQRRLAQIPQLYLREPVFIVGCGRSGTTMLLAILSADPTLYGVSEETEAFADVGPFTPDEARRRRAVLHDFIARETTPFAGRLRFVEKTPKHTHSIDFIRKTYEGKVKFIHIVRDGRDVVTSKHPTTNKETFHVSPRRWVRDVSAALACENDPDMYMIRYEDIIQRFDETMGGLYAYLGQEMPPDAREFSAHATVRRHWAWPEGIRALSPDSIGRWQRPEMAHRVAMLMENPEAVALLKRLNYPV